MKEEDENATLSSLFSSKLKKEEEGVGDSKVAKKAAKRKKKGVGDGRAAEAAKRSKKNKLDDGGEAARNDNCSISSEDEKKKQKREKKLEKTEERVVSTYFPTNRIKRILKDETPDIRTTSDAVFLFNRATKLFLECFTEEAQACARRNHKKSISYDHLSSVVAENNRYEFLSDFVPERLRAKDALLTRTSAE